MLVLLTLTNSFFEVQIKITMREKLNLYRKISILKEIPNPNGPFGVLDLYNLVELEIMLNQPLKFTT